MVNREIVRSHALAVVTAYEEDPDEVLAEQACCLAARFGIERAEAAWLIKQAMIGLYMGAILQEKLRND